MALNQICNPSDDGLLTTKLAPVLVVELKNFQGDSPRFQRSSHLKRRDLMGQTRETWASDGRDRPGLLLIAIRYLDAAISEVETSEECLVGRQPRKC